MGQMTYTYENKNDLVVEKYCAWRIEIKFEAEHDLTDK